MLNRREAFERKMYTTLLVTGLACLIAAIVGGGLKAFQIEIPVLQSQTRQLILAALGIALIVAASIHITPQPSPDHPGPVRKYSGTLSLRQGEAVLFRGLTLKLKGAYLDAEKMPKNAHGTMDDPDFDEAMVAEVSGESEGHSFQGKHHRGEEFNVSSPHCEFSIKFVTVNDSIPASGSAAVQGQCE